MHVVHKNCKCQNYVQKLYVSNFNLLILECQFHIWKSKRSKLEHQSEIANIKVLGISVSTNWLNLKIPACYRGERVFDGPETKAIVQKWIEFYKVHSSTIYMITMQYGRKKKYKSKRNNSYLGNRSVSYTHLTLPTNREV